VTAIRVHSSGTLSCTIEHQATFCGVYIAETCANRCTKCDAMFCVKHTFNPIKRTKHHGPSSRRIGRTLHPENRDPTVHQQKQQGNRTRIRAGCRDVLRTGTWDLGGVKLAWLCKRTYYPVSPSQPRRQRSLRSAFSIGQPVILEPCINSSSDTTTRPARVTVVDNTGRALIKTDMGR
jgi:hypothetical protein